MLHKTKGGSRETDEETIHCHSYWSMSLSMECNKVYPVENIPNVFL